MMVIIHNYYPAFIVDYSHMHSPYDDLTKLAAVFLSGSNVFTNFRTKAKVGNALVFTVATTESGEFFRGGQLLKQRGNHYPYRCTMSLMSQLGTKMHRFVFNDQPRCAHARSM